VPEKWSKALSYITGWAVWLGSLFASASVSLSVGAALVGCWHLSHPEM